MRAGAGPYRLLAIDIEELNLVSIEDNHQCRRLLLTVCCCACLSREPALIVIEGLLMLEVSNTEELYRLFAPVLHTMRGGRRRIDRRQRRPWLSSPVGCGRPSDARVSFGGRNDGGKRRAAWDDAAGSPPPFGADRRALPEN